jgi:hypothetical protein
MAENHITTMLTLQQSIDFAERLHVKWPDGALYSAERQRAYIDDVGILTSWDVVISHLTALNSAIRE